MNNKLQKLFFHSPVRYIISLVVGIIISIIILAKTNFTYLINYVNAFSTACGALIFVGLFSLVSFYGAFTTIGYAFSTISSKRKYHDLFEYTKAKEEKSKHSNLVFMPYIVTGVFFGLISLILSFFK